MNLGPMLNMSLALRDCSCCCCVVVLDSVSGCTYRSAAVKVFVFFFLNMCSDVEQKKKKKLLEIFASNKMKTQLKDEQSRLDRKSPCRCHAHVTLELLQFPVHIFPNGVHVNRHHLRQENSYVSEKLH